jgi:hypothetical protein
MAHVGNFISVEFAVMGHVSQTIEGVLFEPPDEVDSFIIRLGRWRAIIGRIMCEMPNAISNWRFPMTRKGG